MRILLFMLVFLLTSCTAAKNPNIKVVDVGVNLKTGKIENAKPAANNNKETELMVNAPPANKQTTIIPLTIDEPKILIEEIEADFDDFPEIPEVIKLTPEKPSL